MPLLSGDIAIARSAQMNDTAAGGGAPTAQLLPDGASNAIVPDLSEDARVGGLVEIRHLHGVLRNTDTAQLTGANIILAEPPNDPAVSITLAPTRNTFARRPDIEKIIEATSVPGAEYPGFLLENHVAGQRSIQIGQRPGSEPPGVNTTLVLVTNEGRADEFAQYVRVRRVSTSQTTFTESTGQGYVDYPLQVVTCELFSPLARDFAGSAPNRLYARQSGKAHARRVTVTDAGTFYSASRLSQPCQAGDITVKVESIYTQLVPGTRTETPLTDQRPGAARTLTLTDSIGALEVQAASHTDRILVNEAARGYSYTFRLKPAPAPGSVAVSYLVMGAWYTLADDGAGALAGSGSGAVNYHSGALSLTLQALPDLGSPVIVSWADTAPYTNACAAGPITLAQNPPLFDLALAPGGQAQGAVIKWTSSGQARQAHTDAAGNLSGDATGKFWPALGRLLIRPAAWPDAGAAFTVEYASLATASKSFAHVTVDAGGYAQLVLDEEPAPGSVCIEWVTAQKVSKSSGADLRGTGKKVDGVASWSRLTNATRGSKTESSSSSTHVLRHTLTDDGAGHFAGGDGVADYANKTLTARLVTRGASTQGYQSDYEEATSWADANTAYL